MKILLLGKNGQVGWELQRSLAPLGEIVACSRDQADMEKPGMIRKLVQDVSPHIIVNAAAYTAVDKAESEPERARLVNTESVSVLAEEIKRLNGWLVHYSTDYVFDGSKLEVYSENDAANPLSVYGKTKYQGELAIQASGCNHFVFRTSWVYAIHGSNFAKTILRLAKEREELKIVSDQIGAPTSAELIADITALCIYRIKTDSIISNSVSGMYHLVAGGETSWHGYAQWLIREASKNNMALRVTENKVLPIETHEYPLPAKRPANSRLSTKKLQTVFGVILPPWQYHLLRFVTEMAK